MYVLDTHVVSELREASRADANVVTRNVSDFEGTGALLINP